jgi:hypothetical protein
MAAQVDSISFPGTIQPEAEWKTDASAMPQGAADQWL